MIKKTDKILITGCGGMLGEAVYNEFKDRCRVFATDINLNEPWLKYLDVTDDKAMKSFLNKTQPDFLIHLAALTDMEYCQLHPEEALKTNARATEKLAEYALQKNIPFVYISTAGIFDGCKDEYHENDQPNPLSIYGQSKYLGEQAATRVPKHIVIRAGWMMGGGPDKDKKFVNKIIKQIKSGTKRLAVVNDKNGTPCYTYDLARIITHLLDHGYSGVYHGACKGGASRFEVAKFLVEQLDRKDVTVHEVDSNYFAENYFAPRPPSEKLLNTRLSNEADLARDWKICLAEYLTKFNWLADSIQTSGMNRAFYRNYFKAEKEHWLMSSRRQLFANILKKHEVLPSASVLDLGCGAGSLVAQLNSCGYMTYGLDISSEAVRLGTLRGVGNLAVMDNYSLHFPDDSFNAVLMVDILEHLDHEGWLLKEAERVLRPGGIAIAVVPAFKFLWGYHDVISGHYRRYSMDDLRSIIRAVTSFKVVHDSYFNFLLFAPIAALRLLRRIFKVKPSESDFSLNNRLANALFSGVMKLELWLFQKMRFPFGVSVLLVLQKTQTKFSSHNLSTNA